MSSRAAKLLAAVGVKAPIKGFKKPDVKFPYQLSKTKRVSRPPVSSEYFAAPSPCPSDVSDGGFHEFCEILPNDTGLTSSGPPLKVNPSEQLIDINTVESTTMSDEASAPPAALDVDAPNVDLLTGPCIEDVSNPMETTCVSDPSFCLTPSQTVDEREVTIYKALTSSIPPSKVNPSEQLIDINTVESTTMSDEASAPPAALDVDAPNVDLLTGPCIEDVSNPMETTSMSLCVSDPSFCLTPSQRDDEQEVIIYEVSPEGNLVQIQGTGQTYSSLMDSASTHKKGTEGSILLGGHIQSSSTTQDYDRQFITPITTAVNPAEPSQLVTIYTNEDGPSTCHDADSNAPCTTKDANPLAKRKLFEHEDANGMMVVYEDEAVPLPDEENTPVVQTVNNKRSRKDQPADEPRARKRSKNESRWLANVRKSARSAGESYVNRKGKTVAPKGLGPSCGGKCKYKCCDVTEEERRAVHNAYYKEQGDKAKWTFICVLVSNTAPKKTTADPISGKNRSSSRQYHFRINNVMTRVCRTTFLNTLAISETVVHTAVRKLGSECGVSPDGRGLHLNRSHIITSKIRESVISHINSFPRVASHFCRANSECEYLEEEIGTVANMHSLYLCWAKEKGLTSLATERQYRDIFNNTPGLNIKFFKPKKDQCELCFGFEKKTDQEKAEALDEHKDHLRKKDIPRSMKNKDREEAAKSTEFCAAVFDLQKVLFTPKCEAGLLFYHRKLSNYNFTIYDLGEKEGFCYCWHEGIAKRGSNEIASFLLSFIANHVAKGIRRFTFYADNCGGQNKNRMVYSMFMHAAAKFNVTITLRFLVSGHTQNEGDSMHALIEKSSKSLQMYGPEDWWKLIETAKKTGKPYVVKRITQSDVFDFHDFVNNKSQWKVNNLGEKVNWDKVEELHFDGTNPGIIKYKTDIDSEVLKEVNTKYLRPGHPVNLVTYKFPPAYKAELPIAAKKKKDLVMYCDHGIIPTQYHEFYRALKSCDTRSDDFYQGNLRSRNQ